MQLLNHNFHILWCESTSQILYGQYHIWDLFGIVCFRPENQIVFCRKKQSHTQNHGQGTHSAKMGAVVWPKIPKMPPEFLGQSLGLSEKKH
jgi:hypothetical protein